MSEYWLVSAPGKQSTDREETSTRLKSIGDRIEGTQYLSFNFPIHDLRVGTLDSLVELSDILQKQDTYVESVVRKIVSYLVDVLENEGKNVDEHLQVANKTPYRAYLEKFAWDQAKFPIRQSLKDLSDNIVKEIGHVESELKAKSQDYSALKSSIQSYERNQTGSLITRDLDSIVKKDHFAALGSEYLVTVVIVVPNALCKDWECSYEKLIPGKIVPRSSQKIYNDNDNTLYTATLFQDFIDAMRGKCRENKFVLRTFTYDEAQMMKTKEKQRDLEEKRQRQSGKLIPWLRIQFGEAYSGWLHIKALRLFVESVLRYGLPVNFSSALYPVRPKCHKKLRDALIREFDSTGGKGLTEDIEMSKQLGFQTEDFYPYVFYPVKLDFAA